jgi:hypothetical protein
MVYYRLNRFMLLALLPIIAFLVYIEGQRYDPALIRFSPSDISAGAEAALFPREIDGFSRSGVIRVYTKENLYEYVNGHAEYFLSAGFNALAVGEYIEKNSEKDRPDIIVDIYNMGKAIQAFGVLSDEIGDNASSVEVGIMGAKTAQGLSFASGRYYVKITSFQDTMPLELFASRIDEMIGSSASDFKEFSRLPKIGDIVSTRFVKEAYRGLGFAHNVIEREYDIKGKLVQLSLVTGNEAEISDLLSSYLKFFKESDTPYKKVVKDGQIVYTVMDRYEGDWYLLPLRDSLFGIYGDADDEVLEKLVSSIVSNEIKIKGK